MKCRLRIQKKIDMIPISASIILRDNLEINMLGKRVDFHQGLDGLPVDHNHLKKKKIDN